MFCCSFTQCCIFHCLSPPPPQTEMELLSILQEDDTMTISFEPVVASFLVYEVHYTPDDGDQPNSIFLPTDGTNSIALTGLTTGQQYTVLLNTVSGSGERNLIGRTCFTLGKDWVFLFFLLWYCRGNISLFNLCEVSLSLTSNHVVYTLFIS